MSHTGVCLNRVFMFYVNFCIPGAHANFCACKKCEMKSKERNKDEKAAEASYKLIRGV